MDKTWGIAIAEEHIEVIYVEADTEKEAIEMALKESSFLQPEFIDVDVRPAPRKSEDKA